MLKRRLDAELAKCRDPNKRSEVIMQHTFHFYFHFHFHFLPTSTSYSLLASSKQPPLLHDTYLLRIIFSLIRRAVTLDVFAVLAFCQLCSYE